MLQLLLIPVAVYLVIFNSADVPRDKEEDVTTQIFNITPTPFPTEKVETSFFDVTNEDVVGESIEVESQKIEISHEQDGSQGVISLDAFLYQPSNILERLEKKIVLQTSDNPESVTNWYEEKIKGEGMNIQTFVRTSSNDNVLNKLAGSKEGSTLMIEIKREDAGSETKITVSVN